MYFSAEVCIAETSAWKTLLWCNCLIDLLIPEHRPPTTATLSMRKSSNRPHCPSSHPFTLLSAKNKRWAMQNHDQRRYWSQCMQISIIAVPVKSLPSCLWHSTISGIHMSQWVWTPLYESNKSFRLLTSISFLAPCDKYSGSVSERKPITENVLHL